MKARKIIDAMEPGKDILDVLPAMIAIAKEGDEFDRIVDLLVAKGWNDMDLWREIKKLGFCGDHFTMTLRNRLDSRIKHDQTGTRFTYGLTMSYRALKKKAKGL